MRHFLDLVEHFDERVPESLRLKNERGIVWSERCERMCAEIKLDMMRENAVRLVGIAQRPPTVVLLALICASTDPAAALSSLSIPQTQRLLRLDIDQLRARVFSNPNVEFTISAINQPG
jgi:hypothetical protein